MQPLHKSNEIRTQSFFTWDGGACFQAYDQCNVKDVIVRRSTKVWIRTW